MNKEDHHPQKKANEQLHITKSTRKAGRMSILESLEKGIDQGHFDHLIPRKSTGNSPKEDSPTE